MNSTSEVPSPETPGVGWFSDDPELNAGLEWWTNHVANTPDSEAKLQFQRLTEALEEPNRGDADDWAFLVQRAGESILSAIASDFPEDAERRESLGQEAYAAINRALTFRDKQIKLGFVFAGQRFDSETMEAIESLSASRFVVQQVHAWPVRDTSVHPPKLLVRAKVTTS